MQDVARPSAGIAHDVAGVQFPDRPRRREASWQHASETYGPEAVKTGDKCFTKQEGRDTSSYAPTETEPPGGHSKPHRD